MTDEQMAYRAVMVVIAVVFFTIAMAYVADWRNENTQRLQGTERVSLCAQADDVAACIIAIDEAGR